MAEKKKICGYCGQEFIPSYQARKYCSRECGRLANNLKSRERFESKGKYAKATRKAEPKARERARKSNEGLSEDARKEKALGVSYGIYTAFYKNKGELK